MKTLDFFGSWIDTMMFGGPRGIAAGTLAVTPAPLMLPSGGFYPAEPPDLLSPPDPGTIPLAGGPLPKAVFEGDVDGRMPAVARRDMIWTENSLIPSRGELVPDYPLLRMLARSEPILAGCINHRANEARSLTPRVIPRDVRADPTSSVYRKRIEQVTQFLLQPDPLWGERGYFPFWIYSMAENLCTFDACPVVHVNTRKGKPFAWYQVDPPTVRPLADDFANVPGADREAYTFIRQRREVWAKKTSAEVSFFVANPSTDRLYGRPPAERALIVIMNRILELGRIHRWRQQGTVAPIFVQFPSAIKDIEAKKLVGQIEAKIRDLSGDVMEIIYLPQDARPWEPRGVVFDLEADEAYKRELAWTFGLDPGIMVSSKTYAEAKGNAQQSAGGLGRHALVLSLQTALSVLLWKSFGYDDLMILLESPRDPWVLSESQADASDVNAGIIRPSEIRRRRGLDPDPELDALQIAKLSTASTPAAPEDPNAASGKTNESEPLIDGEEPTTKAGDALEPPDADTTKAMAPKRSPLLRRVDNALREIVRVEGEDAYRRAVKELQRSSGAVS